MLTCFFLSQAAGLIGSQESGRAAQGAEEAARAEGSRSWRAGTRSILSPPSKKKKASAWLCHRLNRGCSRIDEAVLQKL